MLLALLLRLDDSANSGPSPAPAPLQGGQHKSLAVIVSHHHVRWWFILNNRSLLFERINYSMLIKLDALDFCSICVVGVNRPAPLTEFLASV
jgi:hypothetical protein